MRKKIAIATLCVLALGCATVGGIELQRQFGEERPRDRVVAELARGQVDYWTEVQPVFDRRCVVCHGCYDAPCQLRLQSIEGLDRGSNPRRVYDNRRLEADRPTRLYQDARTTPEWRERGFRPVLNERAQTPEANRAAGVLYRMLALKARHPLAPDARLTELFDLPIDQGDVCATAEGMDRFEASYPNWGMPYALPGLPDHEQATLLRWIEEGARHTPRPPVDARSRREIERWEAFWNGDSPEEQLVARYLYEHLYLADLHFAAKPPVRWFRIVRSKTPPGQPVDRIATTRPFDDPGVARVWYRIVENPETIIDKTHMPYRLDATRLRRWRKLFLAGDWTVDALPGYEPKVAANPVMAFRDIPVRSRYRFLLDDARFTLMNFIKGPVCRGPTALNVINDRFWIFFLDPDLPLYDAGTAILRENAPLFDLPAGQQSNVFRPISHWREYEKKEKAFLELRAKVIAERLGELRALGLDSIWDGDGRNPNASLTVFRHFDSASVEQGMIGEPPKTAWVMGYLLLERVHYLLVAGFDVFGNLGHQAITRNYMDFLRMEGESNFLYFLPEPQRTETRRSWYVGASEDTLRFLEVPREWDVQPKIAYRTDDPKRELFRRLERHLGRVRSTAHDLSSVRDSGVRRELAKLTTLVGGPVKLLPETSSLEIVGATSSTWVTILRDADHTNITSVLHEADNRRPDRDRLTVVNGFIGSYPNVLFKVRRAELRAFVATLVRMQSESDYARLLDRFGIRRTHPAFWAHSDGLHRAYWEREPLRWGWLDYSRLEAR